MRGDAPSDEARLVQIHDATAWYWDFFVHAVSYGRAYRKLFEILRHEGRVEGVPLRLLDCGVGAGGFTESLARALALPVHACGVDLSLRLLERAVKRLARAGVRASLLRGDVRALPIADAAMDVVLCGLVLDHLGDEMSLAISELARVARPGGLVVVVCPRFARSPCLSVPAGPARGCRAGDGGSRSAGYPMSPSPRAGAPFRDCLRGSRVTPS